MDELPMPKFTDTGRAGKTRGPMERIYHIHEAITDERMPNCSSLAKELEVTPKTIQRDITFMRDRLHLPLEYDDQLHGYRYAADVSRFPVFEMKAADLAGLFLARQAIESVRGTQLEHAMREVFAKLTRSIEGSVRFSWAELDKSLSRKASSVTQTDLKVFGNLAEAVMQRSEVEFLYRKLGSEESEKRRIQPYHLGEVDQCWYLIGRDCDRDGLRTFALPRLKALKIRKERFEVPTHFDGAAYLGTSFGIWTDPDNPDHRQCVRIELRNYAARMAQERRWHPSQQILSLNEKASKVEIRFEVGRLEEVMRWVLSFGSQAKVIAPPELVKMVRNEVSEMRKR
jgi:proteasome accessory factor B